MAIRAKRGSACPDKILHSGVDRLYQLLAVVVEALRDAGHLMCNRCRQLVDQSMSWLLRMDGSHRLGMDLCIAL